MGDYTATRIVHATLVANTVDTVTLGRNYRHVEVINRDGAAEIFVRADGETPTVGGNDCDILTAAQGAIVIDSYAKGNTVVKLISSGTPTYSVIGLRD